MTRRVWGRNMIRLAVANPEGQAVDDKRANGGFDIKVLSLQARRFDASLEA